MNKKITNTATQERVLADGLPFVIEASEAAGQQQLVESCQLPVECHGREQLEAAGVVFGEPCEDDPLFCVAQIPAGWQKRRSDHSMWTDLIDAEGTVRANIFYKAAFYDRRAHIQAVSSD